MLKLSSIKKNYCKLLQNTEVLKTKKFMSEDELLSALSSYESIKYENYDSDTGEILRKKTAMADPTTINKTITEIRNENNKIET